MKNKAKPMVLSSLNIQAYGFILNSILSIHDAVVPFCLFFICHNWFSAHPKCIRLLLLLLVLWLCYALADRFFFLVFICTWKWTGRNKTLIQSTFGNLPFTREMNSSHVLPNGYDCDVRYNAVIASYVHCTLFKCTHSKWRSVNEE